MTDENPYQSPETHEGAAAGVIDGMAPRRRDRLILCGRLIRFIMVLLAMDLVFTVGSGIMLLFDEVPWFVTVRLFLDAGLLACVVFGLGTFAVWGRWLGIALGLWFVVDGILNRDLIRPAFGLFILFTLAQSGRLFGPDRLTMDDLYGTATTESDVTSQPSAD